jgi:hypothetical protein
MTFTYECRAVLEQCKESALSRLEEIHNQRELAVMETLEDIDLAQVQKSSVFRIRIGGVNPDPEPRPDHLDLWHSLKRRLLLIPMNSRLI